MKISSKNLLKKTSFKKAVVFCLFYKMSDKYVNIVTTMRHFFIKIVIFQVFTDHQLTDKKCKKVYITRKKEQ